jgi:hypothetical protein
MDGHRRMVHGGGERDVAAGEAAAFGEAHFAFAEIEPGRAHIATALGRGIDHDRVAIARRVLLDHDGVASCGQDAAGENARGFAGIDAAGEWPPRRDLADQLEPRGRARHVLGAHRIAVHGGDIFRRLRAERAEVFGEDAAFGFG